MIFVGVRREAIKNIRQCREQRARGQYDVCQDRNEHDLECAWDVAEGRTRITDLKERLRHVTERESRFERLGFGKHCIEAVIVRDYPSIIRFTRASP